MQPREQWVALPCRPTYVWPGSTAAPCLAGTGGAGLVQEKRGPGDCKASCEFTVVLASFCQHKKPWWTHVLMTTSRGHCRLEERGETKQG